MPSHPKVVENWGGGVGVEATRRAFLHFWSTVPQRTGSSFPALLVHDLIGLNKGGDTHSDDTDDSTSDTNLVGETGTSGARGRRWAAGAGARA
jgi:hypothetical protein